MARDDTIARASWRVRAHDAAGRFIDCFQGREAQVRAEWENPTHRATPTDPGVRRWTTLETRDPGASRFRIVERRDP